MKNNKQINVFISRQNGQELALLETMYGFAIVLVTFAHALMEVYESSQLACTCICILVVIWRFVLYALICILSSATCHHVDVSMLIVMILVAALVS